VGKSPLPPTGRRKPSTLVRAAARDSQRTAAAQSAETRKRREIDCWRFGCFRRSAIEERLAYDNPLVRSVGGRGPRHYAPARSFPCAGTNRDSPSLATISDAAVQQLQGRPLEGLYRALLAELCSPIESRLWQPVINGRIVYRHALYQEHRMATGWTSRWALRAGIVAAASSLKRTPWQTMLSDGIGGDARLPARKPTRL